MRAHRQRQLRAPLTHTHARTHARTHWRRTLCAVGFGVPSTPFSSSSDRASSEDRRSHGQHWQLNDPNSAGRTKMQNANARSRSRSRSAGMPRIDQCSRPLGGRRGQPRGSALRCRALAPGGRLRLKLPVTRRTWRDRRQPSCQGGAWQCKLALSSTVHAGTGSLSLAPVSAPGGGGLHFKPTGQPEVSSACMLLVSVTDLSSGTPTCTVTGTAHWQALEGG